MHTKTWKVTYCDYNLILCLSLNSNLLLHLITDEGMPLMGWTTRMKIEIGAAQGCLVIQKNSIQSKAISLVRIFLIFGTNSKEPEQTHSCLVWATDFKKSTRNPNQALLGLSSLICNFNSIKCYLLKLFTWITYGVDYKILFLWIRRVGLFQKK